MTLKLSGFSEVVKEHVRAEFHRAKCSGSWVIVLTTFLPYLPTVKNPKIRSCDLDLWPWNSPDLVRLSRNMFMQNFIELSAAVNELSCVQRKGTPPKTIQSVATADRNYVNVSESRICGSRGDKNDHRSNSPARAEWPSSPPEVCKNYKCSSAVYRQCR